MRRFVYWHTYLVEHSTALMKAMARSGVETVWVANQAMIGERKDIWQKSPDLPGIEVVVSPDDAEIRRIMDVNPEDTVHLFQGFRGHRLVETALPLARSKKLQIGVFSENRPLQGQWAWTKVRRSPISTASLRKLHYRLEAIRSRKAIKFLLVAGYSGPNGGRKYFNSVGFPDHLLHPFGYWMDSPETCKFSSVPGDFHLVYAGQCIPRKAGDVMIASLGLIKDVPWRLTLIGDGPERENWARQASEMGISDRIEFRGALPLEETQTAMETADAFVLPSHFDGWGMVTAEALSRGAPVICTDRCGSSDLLASNWRGSVVPAGDPPAMAEAIRARVGQGKHTVSDAEKIWRWSKTIDGDHMAAHLKAIIAHAIDGAPRPDAQWLRT